MSVTVITKLKGLVASERKITAEVVECIREIDARRTYLDLGFTSLFEFLTKEIRYTPAAAQRRIDAARILKMAPEIKAELKTGELNLTQVSMIAQGLRQKCKEESGYKVDTQAVRDLLESVKTKDLGETQKTIAQDLNLEIQLREKATIQKDESVRMEITLSKEVKEKLDRIKVLSSHVNGNPNMNELIGFLAEEYLKRKDPARKGPNVATVEENERVKMSKDEKKEAVTSVAEVTERQNPRAIPAAVRREIFNRDQTCQWKSPDGKACTSQYQLQIDHIKPIWAGGGGEKENLQLLCGIHNRLKFENEMGIDHKLLA